MKPFLTTILICLGLINPLKSQELIPFPLENAYWLNGHYSCTDVLTNCYLSFTSQYFTAGDTLINGTVMTKILTDFPDDLWEQDNQGPPRNYVAALREESGRVYLVPWFQDEEILLFDFTLEVGETVQVFAGGFEPELIVEDITYEDFDGITRKVIHFSYGKWIEGVGSDRGLFWEITPNVSGYYTWQECVIIDSEVIFDHEQGVLNCIIQSVSEIDRNISIYPIPADDRITVDGITGKCSFEILDFQGRRIQSEKISPERNTIILNNDLTPGIYLIRLEMESSVLLRRIVIE